MGGGGGGGGGGIKGQRLKFHTAQSPLSLFKSSPRTPFITAFHKAIEKGPLLTRGALWVLCWICWRQRSRLGLDC